MKAYLVVLCIFNGLFLFGQSGLAPIHTGADGIEQPRDTTHIYRLELLNGKTFEEISADSTNYTVRDAQIYKNSILHLKVIDNSNPNDVYEFYRIDDLKYVKSKYADKKLIESGVIKNDTNTLKTDTIILIDIFESKNLYYITHYYKAIKSEFWTEQDKSGKKITGHYKDGKKQGVWYWWGGLCPSLRYNQGKVVSLFCPNNELIIENINLLWDKEYVRCPIQLHRSDLFEFSTKEEPMRPLCGSNQLVLSKNGHFSCEGFNIGEFFLKRGEGEWSIKDNQILFSYPTKETFNFEIEGFGPTFLNLKIAN
jgi:hypothetical protein